jgi:hypothetical protein
MLRGFRRRLHEARNEPLARFSLRVLAVSPFEEEPEPDSDYLPSLIVESSPAPGEGDLPPAAFAIGALLFVEWVTRREASDEPILPIRLRALLPRLRVAVRGGHLGPGRYAAHRAGQQERYFHHREAAVFDLALLRDDTGLYLSVKSRIVKGPWTEASALLEAATLAPYETLLRAERDEALATLAWLDLAVKQWLRGYEAGFPVAAWDMARPLQPPGEG